MPLYPSDGLYPHDGLYPDSGAGPSTFTAGVLSSMVAWTPPLSDFNRYTAALAAMFEPVWAIVSNQGSPDDPASYTAGWSILLDVDRCPTQYLPFLGMFVGIYVQPGTADATARAMIRARSSWSRGTPAGIDAAIQSAQSAPDPSKYWVTERQGAGGPDAYHFLITIDETSLATPGDPTALIAAVTAVKPAGVQFTVNAYTAPWLSQYSRLLSAVVVPLAAATLADVV